jgi:hypothetical protein
LAGFTISLCGNSRSRSSASGPGNRAIHTTSTTAQFDHLSRGDHRIQVALVGNDNKPVGEQTTLKVHVP